MTPSPTQSQIMQALGNFLTDILPAGVQIIVGQENRVPEPQSGDFAVMTTIRRERLETNLDLGQDVKFTGSIAGRVLTVSAVAAGTIIAGASLFGAGISVGTTIVSQSGGTPGGAGAYIVSAPQTVGSETMSSGGQTVTQNTLVVVQIDVHSANTLDSADMAQTISTLLRDAYAVDFFAGQAPPLNAVSPLHADDPRQVPFINDSSQVESRWIVESHLQANQTLLIPAEFADSADVVTKDVNALYPA